VQTEELPKYRAFGRSRNRDIDRATVALIPSTRAHRRC
jgi:hypothetical protein